MSIVKIKVLHQKFGEMFTHEKKGYGFILLDSFGTKSGWQFIFTENLIWFQVC